MLFKNFKLNYICNFFLLLLFFSFFTFFIGLLFSSLIDLFFSTDFLTQSSLHNNSDSILSLDEKIEIFKKNFAEKYISGHFLEDKPFIRSTYGPHHARLMLDQTHTDHKYYSFLNELNTVEEIEAKAEQMAHYQQKNAIYIFFGLGLLALIIQELFR